MTEDDDKEVVAQACMGIADIVKDIGYMVIEPCKYGTINFILLCIGIQTEDYLQA